MVFTGHMQPSVATKTPQRIIALRCKYSDFHLFLQNIGAISVMFPCLHATKTVNL